MKRVMLFLLCICSAFHASAAGAIDLPAAPSGFQWQQIKEQKAAFLRPDGWFFLHEEKDGTSAYFITQEDIGKTGGFNTGLTVNVFRLKKDSPVARGKQLIDNMAAQHHAATLSRDFGPFKEFACDLENTDASGTTKMHALAVANPKTGTLYLILFESPVSEWKSAWAIGQLIMENLALDDEN